MHKHIVSKLVTGDMFIGVLISETADEVTVLNPLTLKIVEVPEENELVEKTTLVPFCRYTNEKVFILKKSTLLYYKDLNPFLCEYYDKLIKSIDEEERALEHMVEDLLDQEEDQVFDYKNKILYN